MGILDKIKRKHSTGHHAAKLKTNAATLQNAEVLAMMSERSQMNDLIHELKHINRSLEKSSKVFKDAIERLNQGDNSSETIRILEHTNKSILALAQISDCRMEYYEYMINPIPSLSFQPQTVSIYREFEKIYKSLNDGWCDQKRYYNLKGESRSRFSTLRIVSIGIFILLENAAKYTLPDEEITIEFDEQKDSLTVKISNWGPLVTKEELAYICQRGFRGEEARKKEINRGDGIGLGVAKDIFEQCNVEFSVDSDDKNLRKVDDINYGKFCATLKFSPIKLQTSDNHPRRYRVSRP